ncbi:Ti-type conjugative transfer relaxase TraA [Ensifer sp. Root278]|uniref:Ti-type conjugative transfer relaxase TraA n=1 Tax=Ensifer sp. Root278 TaxID=1736509 RepID=UPI00070DCABC|nr:Ti-type conjugative transfer relaxase TraA [Ensifer sp. Root278]KRD65953.1 Dtr system oriT relaxase [Ensifer sp. Root278]
MVSPHFDVNVISRGKGRSAVLSAAYKHRAKMYFEREATTANYSEKRDLLYEEFAIPVDAPEWLRLIAADPSAARASEAFWNRVENFEERLDAQLAKDVTLALPIELTSDQNIALVREFVEQHVLGNGMVADWAYHNTPGNPHAHLMMTLRPLTVYGFGSKKIKVVSTDGTPRRSSNGRIVYRNWVGGLAEFNAFRDGWFACQNRHLALAGLDLRIDGRSFERQGIDLEPIIRFSAETKAIERRIEREKTPVFRKPKSIELQAELRARNTRRIQRRPEIAIDLIASQKSVFDERDIAKVLHRYTDDERVFAQLMARILQSPEILRIDRERIDLMTGARFPAKYTTRKLIRLEAEMAKRAAWLARQSTHGIRKELTRAMSVSRLSTEQQAAIANVTGEGRLTAVVGRAGAGKTTMMKVAREIWTAAGYQVVGGALAGKAAEGLEKEAGICAATLSSWERRWAEGNATLNNKTVFILDEAGMVSSRQMASLIETVAKEGAKLVLVGDPDQLQPIEAGAPFRAIVERIGYSELDTIYRQRQDWMRTASLALARGQVGDAVRAYEAHDRIVSTGLKAEAVEALIADWDRDHNPTKTSLILAHLRRDVRTLNEKARAKLVERGVVGKGLPFATQEGVRHFAAGDQIVFLKNDGILNVKNGMIGRVLEARLNRIVVEVGEPGYRRPVTIESRIYPNVDLGYATTIHKSQGATVDSVKLLASLSLDRHLTYVGMTRHREELAVYYGRRSFENAAGLVSVLSRTNAKESTLDYTDRSLYRHALRFAELRGLHLMAVARTLVRDRIEWTVRQKQRLSDLVQRLTTIGQRFWLATAAAQMKQSDAGNDEVPMLAGIKTFSRTFAETIEERLAADESLKRQWEDVSLRFRLVYADPQMAFHAIDVEAMLKNEDVAGATLAKIARSPETFGALNGKSGVLAWRTDKQDRERALANLPALSRNLALYIRLRHQAEEKYRAEEQKLRTKLAIDIPAISSQARQVLTEARDAIGRKDVQSALHVVHADSKVRAELERFSTAVTERFGERTFLAIAARDANGAVFKEVAAGMTAAQREDLRAVWSLLRTIQQVAAHERVSVALKQAASLRQTRSQGLSPR